MVSRNDKRKPDLSRRTPPAIGARDSDDFEDLSPRPSDTGAVARRREIRRALREAAQRNRHRHSDDAQC